MPYSRPDFSEYVGHFTKSAPAIGETTGKITGDAFARLINILSTGQIWATPMPWTNRPAVAFTECPWGSLIDHAHATPLLVSGSRNTTSSRPEGDPLFICARI